MKLLNLGLYKERNDFMEKVLTLFVGNVCLKIVVLLIVLDTILGVLRAVKEKKVNSNFGINGAIRKIAMLISVTILVLFDRLLHINFIAFIPKEVLTAIGIQKVGLCEFFCILFMLYEAISILKNMMLCGLPVPKRLQRAIQQFLDEMTDELEDNQQDR